MDIVRRLVAALLLLMSVGVVAQTCPDGGTCVPVKWHSGTPTDYADTPEAQFARWLDWAQSAQYQSYTAYQSRGACQIYSASAICPYRATKGLSTYDGSVGMYATCPVGQMVIAAGAVGERLCSVPSCPSGQIRNPATGICGLDCPANKELDEELGTCVCKSIRDAGMHMVAGDTYTGCNEGCRMVLNSGWFDKTAGVTWGNWSQSSAACVVGDNNVIGSTDPRVEAAKKCTAGTCPGTVNGQSVCLPCDKSKETGTTTKTESSSTTASGASSPSSSGTSRDSTTTKTECSGGQCKTTTTTTSTGADGTSTDKTTETTEPQSDYCTDNPKAAVCKGTESSWGGTCDAFTCDGDAVQCAQAKGAWELACTLQTDSSSTVVQTGQQAVAGTLSDSKPTETTASIGQFNAQNPYQGTCPQDVTVAVAGHSFIIPLSESCSWIQAIGWFLVAGATLAGARIAFT